MQNTLDNSLVNSLDSNLVGSLGSGLVAGNQSSVELLQVGLQLGLVGLVLLVSDLGRDDILLGGLDVGHELHLLFPKITSGHRMPFMQKQIIPYFPQEINPFFKNNSRKLQAKNQPSGRLSRGRINQISPIGKIHGKMHNLSLPVTNIM